MNDSVDPADPVGLRPVLDPNILRYAVLAYVVVLPIGQLLRFPVNGTVNGAVVTASDWFLGVVILAGVVELSRMSGHYLRNRGGDLPPLPGMSTFHFAALLFMAFSAWVALGVLWGAYPDYAVAKGLTFAALALGALAMFWCGAEWGKVADAWILGTVLCLCVTWVGALVGPEVVRSQVIFGSESIRGLPVPRMSGPFEYPNVFGEYLVVSAALLWARWTGVRRKWGRGASVVAWVLAVTLLLTASSAWLAAGVLMISFGLLTIRRRQGRPTLDRKRPAPILFLFGGVVLFTVTLAGLVVPLGVDIAGLSVAGTGLRPVIWASAWDAVKESLIGGVGASPYLAIIADPLAPTSPVARWDAHNVYISVLGQYGVVGFVLLGGAVTVLVRTLIRGGVTRRHSMLLVALLAVGIHGISVANEEFRHVWALLGLVGLASVPDWARGRWQRDESGAGDAPGGGAAAGATVDPTVDATVGAREP